MANPQSRTATAAERPAASDGTPKISRERLIGLLNEDLAREYQAIIAYVIYSQAIKGSQYMHIAKELEVHAAEELAHAMKIAKHIDYLGGDMVATPKPVKLSDDTKDMLRFDLENEAETIKAYRERVREAEAIGEFAIAAAPARRIAVQRLHGVPVDPHDLRFGDQVAHQCLQGSTGMTEKVAKTHVRRSRRAWGHRRIVNPRATG